MKIIKERKEVEKKEYFIEFVSLDNPGGGFWFKCDKEGNLLQEELSPIGARVLAECAFGTLNVKKPKLREVDSSYTEPAQGLCDICGGLVYLTSFTNECDQCGTEYNFGGKRLAPRSQWGEETGEVFL